MSSMGENMEQAAENPRRCRAADIAKKLRMAIIRTTNDDMSVPGSLNRRRHKDSK